MVEQWWVLLLLPLAGWFGWWMRSKRPMVPEVQPSCETVYPGDIFIHQRTGHQWWTRSVTHEAYQGHVKVVMSIELWSLDRRLT